jgi:pyridinium-3,5-bisthiocarboxylic acid mononucleotide nickel chelatase
MILGALIDAGVELQDVRRALGSLAIAPDTVWTEPVLRAGIRATKFNVRGETHPVDGHHDHEHDHHREHAHVSHGTSSSDSHGHESPSHRQASGSHGHESPSHRHAAESHRTLSEIFRLVDSSSLSVSAKDRTKQLFTVLGEAEAAIHGTPIDRVHLHEVGALDSIIDIAGTVFALEQLGVDRIVSSALNVGGGTIHAAHGHYPVPAPATMRLLKGAPVYSGAQKVELVTPTGALLIAGYAAEYGSIPAMRVERVGYGAGTRDFPDSPNVLRVLIGQMDAAAPSHSVVVIEAEIDDMNPQIFGVLMDRLLAEGALDVFYTSIQMKKNRPGTLLTIVAPPNQRDRLTSVVFRETTTIGVRYREMSRECLDRESMTVTTELGAVRIKVARRRGELLNAAPEFDDCVRLATEHQVPTKHVQALAMKAFLETTKRGL